MASALQTTYDFEGFKIQAQPQEILDFRVIDISHGSADLLVKLKAGCRSFCLEYD